MIMKKMIKIAVFGAIITFGQFFCGDEQGKKNCSYFQPFDEAKNLADYSKNRKKVEAELEEQERVEQIQAYRKIEREKKEQDEKKAKEEKWRLILAREAEFTGQSEAPRKSLEQQEKDNKIVELNAAKEMEDYLKEDLMYLDIRHQKQAALHTTPFKLDGITPRDMSDIEKKARRKARLIYLQNDKDISYFSRLFAPVLSYFEFMDPKFHSPCYDLKLENSAREIFQKRLEDEEISRSRDIVFVTDVDSESPLRKYSGESPEKYYGQGNFYPEGFNTELTSGRKFEYSPKIEEKTAPWSISKLLFAQSVTQDPIEYKNRKENEIPEKSKIESKFTKYCEPDKVSEWNKSDQLKKMLDDRLA
jgi:hypothetical protein